MRGRNPVDRRQPNARKPNSASANLGCQVVQQCKVPVPTSASTVPYIEAFEASERKLSVSWPILRGHGSMNLWVPDNK